MSCSGRKNGVNGSCVCRGREDLCVFDLWEILVTEFGYGERG